MTRFVQTALLPPTDLSSFADPASRSHARHGGQRRGVRDARRGCDGRRATKGPSGNQLIGRLRDLAPPRAARSVAAVGRVVRRATAAEIPPRAAVAIAVRVRPRRTRPLFGRDDLRRTTIIMSGLLRAGIVRSDDGDRRSRPHRADWNASFVTALAVDPRGRGGRVCRHRARLLRASVRCPRTGRRPVSQRRRWPPSWSGARRTRPRARSPGSPSTPPALASSSPRTRSRASSVRTIRVRRGRFSAHRGHRDCSAVWPWSPGESGVLVIAARSAAAIDRRRALVVEGERRGPVRGRAGSPDVAVDPHDGRRFPYAASLGGVVVSSDAGRALARRRDARSSTCR